MGGAICANVVSRVVLRRACLLEAGLSTYRGTSLMRKLLSLGPYSRHMPRALCWFYGGGGVLVKEVTMSDRPVCHAGRSAILYAL